MADYTPPKGHDKHLSDSERAHSGKPGMKERHGADAVGLVTARKTGFGTMYGPEPDTSQNMSKFSREQMRRNAQNNQ